MQVSQLIFVLNSLIIGVSIAVGYWFERSLIGVYLGWLAGSLTGIFLNELIVGLAGSIV